MPSILVENLHQENFVVLTIPIMMSYFAGNKFSDFWTCSRTHTDARTHRSNKGEVTYKRDDRKIQDPNDFLIPGKVNSRP